MPEEANTLSELLMHHGWDTAGFSHNINISSKTGFEQGFGTFEAYDGGVLAYPHVGQMADDAIRWLRKPRRRPFFLYLQPMNVHGPYRVPEARRGDLLGRPPKVGFDYQSLTVQALMHGALNRRQEVSPDLLASLSEQYDTAIRYTFDEIARVLESLSSEVLENSLIVLTADHGEELYDHEGFSHGYSLYEENVRVPLFVKWPGAAEPQVVTEPVSLLDVFPTVLEVAGVPRPQDLDGSSLRPSLQATEAEDRAFLLEADLGKRCKARGIVQGRYKLVEQESNYEGRKDEFLLFDLEDDPGETIDLSDVLPEVTAELLESMRQRFAAAASRRLEYSLDDPIELDTRTLEALGYL